MSELSPRLDLPFIQPSQAQKHITHNEAIELLDAVVQLRLEDTALTTPPASPSEGQAWFVAATAADAWTGRDGQIASWRNNGWLYLTPKAGWCAWVTSQNRVLVFDGSDWVAPVTDADLNNVSGVGINTTSDASNPLSVSGPSTLLSHEGSGHQLKLNKASATDTASLLFQTGFSGRAEIGLNGSDEFTAKVSSDGSNWVDVLALGQDRVSLNQVVSLVPQTEPATGAAGDLYFDSSSNKLRCYDGTAWNDLF